MKRRRLPLKRSLEARQSSPLWHQVQSKGTAESPLETETPPCSQSQPSSPEPIFTPQYHQSTPSASSPFLEEPHPSVSIHQDSIELAPQWLTDPRPSDSHSLEDLDEELWAQAGCSGLTQTVWDDTYRKQRVVKKQATLFSFMSVKPSSSNTNDVTGTRTCDKTEQEVGVSTKREKLVPKSSSRKSGSTRTCPFYKKIPGTPFSVDAFQYSSIPNCKVYFLTHFHADHYAGLRKRFQHPIYCSQVTSSLVQLQLKVAGMYLHPVPLNEPFVVENVEVTFLDANHCPGSVLILFKLKSGQNYLHTGDFRFSPLMLLYPPLVGLTIHQLYLDTTYCDSCYDFPSQEQVIAFAVEKCLNSIHSCPNTLIVCGSYTIGKEKVFMAIADVLGTKICVSREKKVILDCLDFPVLSRSLTTDYNQSCLHVLPMTKLNLKDLSIYFQEWSTRYSQLLAFKPTGWTHSRKPTSLSCIQPQAQGAVRIYGIPYSEHSSFGELRRCVEGWRPHKIIPTVNNFSAHRREEMQRIFQKWLSTSKSKSQVQTKLKIKK